MEQVSSPHRLLSQEDTEVFLIRIPQVDLEKIEAIEWELQSDGSYVAQDQGDTLELVQRKTPSSVAIVWGDGETARTRWITTQWTLQKKVPRLSSTIPSSSPSVGERETRSLSSSSQLLDNLQVRNWTPAQLQ
ncbi:hypothetical protein GAYE_SCF66G6835 [Galdieria yellowstonensis]|uniref:Uncharacterized protein n=1 Tax=Galdieria yellowstonensis TaxID=3028027 RepID=A0AAV9INL1_9RHOD|nr:hypothetical protein GAYE_SCF66G6835 [Galdieria yellowstonensis]